MLKEVPERVVRDTKASLGEVARIILLLGSLSGKRAWRRREEHQDQQRVG
jgi:hypothetical protein